ncbi:hypothetical protein BDV06DRAFT_229034 [Aspergillus oleicola]
MKGVGHNFSIVINTEMRLYPRKIDTWQDYNYIWTQDKLGTVFEALNRFQRVGQIPALIGANFVQFSVEPSTNETEPVINWTFSYAGPADEAEDFLREFNEIEAIFDEQGDATYTQLLVAQETASTTENCVPAPIIGSIAHLQAYNITA